MSQDVRADVIADLTYLRKGAGLKATRLSKAGTVLRLLGDAGTPSETSLERLTSAIRSLGGSADGQALWAAFGLNGDVVGDLTARRAVYGKSVGKDEYTLREWEDRAVEELALRLLSRFYAGSPTTPDLAIPHGGFLLQELVTTYLYRDRRFVESQQARTVISLVDGAVGFVYGTYTRLSSRSYGGEVTSRRVRDGSLHEIRFPRRLRRAEQHRFTFREVVVADDAPDELPHEDVAGQTFESPTLRFRVEVCFLGERPDTIWTYDKLSRIERPGEPNQSRLIEPPGQLVTADFADLYGGLCSGLAWRWQ